MIDITKVNNELSIYIESLKEHKLYDPVSYILSLDAKRIRPALFLESLKVFGGDEQSSLPLAVAIEVFHNFTLLHDDIMDNSSLRRGKPTVHEKWDVNSAILSGDAMMILAYQLINKLPITHQSIILQEFNAMGLLLCEGQQDDMDFEERELVSIEEYIEMITNKTSVLLAFSLKAGAILANASKEIQDTIHSFGINMGIAFQLQDDYMDLYPKSDQMGKVVGGDLMNRKKALPLLLALQDSAKKDEIINVLNSKKQDRIKILTELFSTLSIKKQCEDLIEKYYTIANEHLATIEGYDTKIFSDFCATLHRRVK